MKLNILNSREYEDAINLLCKSEESWWLAYPSSFYHSLLTNYFIIQVTKRGSDRQAQDSWLCYKSFCFASVPLAVLPLFSGSHLAKDKNYYWYLKKHGIKIPWSNKKLTLANMTPNQRPHFPPPPSAAQGPHHVEAACSILFCNYRANCPVFPVIVEKLNWRKILRMSNCRL